MCELSSVLQALVKDKGNAAGDVILDDWIEMETCGIRWRFDKVSLRYTGDGEPVVFVDNWPLEKFSAVQLSVLLDHFSNKL